MPEPAYPAPRASPSPRPVFLAVPFEENLIRQGLGFQLALKLFESGVITLSQAAKIAQMPLAEFMEKTSQAGVAAVDYDPAELEREKAVFDG